MANICYQASLPHCRRRKLALIRRHLYRDRSRSFKDQLAAHGVGKAAADVGGNDKSPRSTDDLVGADVGQRVFGGVIQDRQAVDGDVVGQQSSPRINDANAAEVAGAVAGKVDDAAQAGDGVGLDQALALQQRVCDWLPASGKARRVQQRVGKVGAAASRSMIVQPTAVFCLAAHLE